MAPEVNICYLHRIPQAIILKIFSGVNFTQVVTFKMSKSQPRAISSLKLPRENFKTILNNFLFKELIPGQRPHNGNSVTRSHTNTSARG